jgi:hypothetical protein
MPFIHFIEILLQNHALAPSLGAFVVRVIILTDSLKCISIDTIRAMLVMITPKTPRSRRLNYMKLLGKVDPFPSFLLEMAHNEDIYAIAPQAGNGLVADICRRDNRLCSGAL